MPVSTLLDVFGVDGVRDGPSMHHLLTAVPNIKMGLRYQRCCVGSQVAFPAFDCTSSSTVHAVLEAGSALYRPVMMQFSEMLPHSLQRRDCLTDFALRMFPLKVVVRGRFHHDC